MAPQSRKLRKREPILTRSHDESATEHREMEHHTTPEAGTEKESESGIECLCCFEESPFEGMVQCREGHLVCMGCLTTYTQHQTYGAAKLELQCMADDCTSSYPRSEMERCLSQSIVSKWDERIQEENLKLSGLELSRCPGCQFACVLSPSARVLACKREACRRKSCRDCGVDWTEHEGKECEEVEKKGETSLRKEYEEKMTKATLRICPKCKTPFYKGDGCNKMSCQCGMTMCYICRKSGITYQHFCTHPHSPGKGCTQCQRCLLWTSSKKDDELAISVLRDEAEKRRETLGYKRDSTIGVPKSKQRPTKLNV